MLTYWRTRLRRRRLACKRIFEVVREVVAATGVLSGKTRRALDSTVLDDAVATQDTVTQLIAAIRRGAPAVAVPSRRGRCGPGHDYDRAGKPGIAWDDTGRQGELVSGLVRDARCWIAALDGIALTDEDRPMRWAFWR